MNLVIYIGYSDNLAKNPISPPLLLFPLCSLTDMKSDKKNFND